MKPNYIAHKSAWSAWSPTATLLFVLLFWTIVPIFVQIFRTISAKKYYIEFYDDKIVEHKGWLNTSAKTMTFNGVTSVSISKSLWGTMFGYGDVVVDAVGYWDVSTDYIKEPEKMAAYLQTRIVKINVNPHALMDI